MGWGRRWEMANNNINDNTNNLPDTFLEIRVNKIDKIPLMAACAGYENGEWRTNQLSEHAIEWLPDFSLNSDEAKTLNTGNVVSLVKKSAKLFFEKRNIKTWGELGELLLHILIRQEKKTVPLVHKLYYKSSPNETIKGFDCVHITKEENENYHLWLGEAKLHKDINSAIRSVIDEIERHIDQNYLKKEFFLIGNKIEKIEDFDNEKIKKLFHKNTSLDDVFEKIIIPVLLTYNSACISEFDSITQEYKEKFCCEVIKHWDSFKNKATRIPSNLSIQLFLLPLKDKDELVEAFSEELGKLQ